MATPTFFFAQDQESHWYLMPTTYKESWDILSQKESPWEYDGWQKIEDCRLDGGIESITFENPKK